MNYVAVKNTRKDDVPFPCIREGMNSGELYLFQTPEDRGIGLRRGFAPLWSTRPWSGTVTITQE